MLFLALVILFGTIVDVRALGEIQLSDAARQLFHDQRPECVQTVPLGFAGYRLTRTEDCRMAWRAFLRQAWVCEVLNEAYRPLVQQWSDAVSQRQRHGEDRADAEDEVSWLHPMLRLRLVRKPECTGPRIMDRDWLNPDQIDECVKALEDLEVEIRECAKFEGAFGGLDNRDRSVGKDKDDLLSRMHDFQGAAEMPDLIASSCKECTDVYAQLEHVTTLLDSALTAIQQSFDSAEQHYADVEDNVTVLEQIVQEQRLLLEELLDLIPTYTGNSTPEATISGSERELRPVEHINSDAIGDEPPPQATGISRRSIICASFRAT